MMKTIHLFPFILVIVALLIMGGIIGDYQTRLAEAERENRELSQSHLKDLQSIGRAVAGDDADDHLVRVADGERPSDLSDGRYAMFWNKPIQFGDAYGEMIFDGGRARCVYWDAENPDQRVNIRSWADHDDPSMNGKRSELAIDSPVEPVVSRNGGRWTIAIPAESF
jgi:hypothetical protein